MKMHQIEYLLALCEEGNFTRAARRCGVAQPSLTNAIRDLEAILGGALFYRGPPRSRMTKLGSLVKPRLQKIKIEAERAIEIAQQFTTQLSSEA